jgi:poly-beta-1,6-N-acetyl-D-glucosamine N-deacetylase
MRVRALLLAVVLAVLGGAAFAAPAGAPKFVVLNYHDVRDDVDGQSDRDPDATSTDHLIAHFDWLKANGYHVVSLEQVIEASQGRATLPDHAVVLTFDDGLESFYTRVFPLLRAYGYPAVAAVVGSWMDLPQGQTVDYAGQACSRDCFLTWDQVRRMSASGLVEFASHTWGLHKGITANPQGNQIPAAASLAFDQHTGRYETEDAYAARIRSDLRQASDEFLRETGRRPRAIAWPYGDYTDLGARIAASEGMTFSFSLDDGPPPFPAALPIPRLLVADNIGASSLAWLLRHPPRNEAVRAVQVDLDDVYDPNPEQQERNLSQLLDRIKRLHVNEVWLQAYADPDGAGVASAAYFPSRHLPMRADLFSRVEWQLRTRTDVKVFAWMPVLAFRFADAPDLPALAEAGKGGGDPYRLAPWDPKVRQLVSETYEDLAMHCDLAGVLFSDDAFIRDTDRLGPWSTKTPAERTDALIGFTHELADRVRAWRPFIQTARNIYARPVFQPASEAWFAQSLPAFLKNYDLTAIMAMPSLDGQVDTTGWYKGLLADVKRSGPTALDGALFELAAKDWRRKAPVDDKVLADRIAFMEAGGARNLAYYPDDFIADHPSLEVIRPVMSAATYPYREPSPGAP